MARGSAGVRRRMSPGASSPVRAPRVRASRAQTPRIRPGLASAGNRLPSMGGSGVPRATTAMASTPSRYINKPKVGRPGRGLGKPRADFPSKI